MSVMPCSWEGSCWQPIKISCVQENMLTFVSAGLATFCEYRTL